MTALHNPRQAPGLWPGWSSSRRSASLRVAPLLLLVACKQHDASDNAHPPPLLVHCGVVTRATLDDERTLRGTVAAVPEHDAVLAPQIAGRLLRVPLREGSVVRAGAVVAEVESQPTRDALVQASAQLAQAEAIAKNSETTLARAQQLFDKGIVARQQVDDARTKRVEAQAGVAVARAATDVAGRNLGRAMLRSPIDGVVVRVLRHAGELVDGTTATAVLEVADPKQVELVASASAVDLVALREGQEGSVTFEALPGQSYVAHVRSVSPAIDPASGVGTVRISLDAAATVPPLGLFGSALIHVGARGDAVVVAPAALRTAGAAGVEVVVCDQGKARVRSVETGVRAAKQVEILRGLASGDRVILDNVVGIEDGTSITEAP